MQQSETKRSSAGHDADNTSCDKSSENWATIEIESTLGKGRKKNLSAPTAKLSIHDGTTKSEAKFEIGEKGVLKVTGYAENTVDEGSTHINEKGAFVTTVGASGNSCVGLASIENEAKTNSGSINAVKTEFDVKTEVHVDAKTKSYIGTKSTAEVKLNLLETQFEHIAKLKSQYLEAGQPVVGIDTKKKELLDNFYRAGKLCTQKPIEVLDLDFLSYAEGKVVPHGIYYIANWIGATGGALSRLLLQAQSHRTPHFSSHVSRACEGVVFDSVVTVKHLMERTQTQAGVKVTVGILKKVYESG